MYVHQERYVPPVFCAEQYEDVVDFIKKSHDRYVKDEITCYSTTSAHLLVTSQLRGMFSTFLPFERSFSN
jgi:hypothetical protein